MKNKIKGFLRVLAHYILATVKPEEQEIDNAVRNAFKESGLNIALYEDDFDLLHSGKFHEVLFHASKTVGNPLVTVADLKNLLK